MAKLAKKVAVITGGSSGIGLITAQTFVEHGARVAIFGRDQKALDSAAASLGNAAIAVQGDVTKAADLERLFQKTAETFGKVDIVFANAGAVQFRPIEHADEEFFDRLMNVNAKGAFLTARAAMAHLNPGASIIFNSSLLATKGFANCAVYSAAKGAVSGMMRSLAAELIPKGIRVNAVSPGPIETPIYGKLELPKEMVEGLGQTLAAASPVKRFGTGQEVANAVAFLASPESSYVVGTELAVDGGMGPL
ncbi:MAG TPA: SDR family oxidoreductase [Myxococcaceae bacterium]|nr:SDR family oxidoreductase [Myxococcaceae bacterium]